MSAKNPSPLGPPKRFITDHDGAGKAVFSTALPEEVPATPLPNGAVFQLGYVTAEAPVELNGGRDIAVYARSLEEPPGIVLPGGTITRYVDMPPEHTSEMHRTVSCDYGVVLEGDIELILDSGETRQMKRGDMAVQRGTSHAWRNPSQTAWARMLFVLQDAHPVDVGGRKLVEDYGGLVGLPKSGH